MRVCILGRVDENRSEGDTVYIFGPLDGGNIVFRHFWFNYIGSCLHVRMVFARRLEFL